jgi:hypothetical protein
MAGLAVKPPPQFGDYGVSPSAKAMAKSIKFVEITETATF